MPSQTEKLGRWHIFETADAVAEHVAEWLCALACARDGELAICLSGGSTPRPLYQRLASPGFASRVPWSRIHWFWGDERFVPHDDPASNYRMAYDALFLNVPIPQNRLHPIPTEGLSPQQAAADYQALLQRFYGNKRLGVGQSIFDVTLLGLGADGHTASLFPGSLTLLENRQWVLAVVGKASEARITLTYPALNSSRNLAFLVTGANKKNILAEIRAGSTAPPAARVRPIGPRLVRGSRRGARMKYLQHHKTSVGPDTLWNLPSVPGIDGTRVWRRFREQALRTAMSSSVSRSGKFDSLSTL
jgi:6-phosphogluconolactonase